MSAANLRLHCTACGERFPEGMVMEAVQIHFQVEHETDEVSLALKAVCGCGATMDFSHVQHRAGGERDHFTCPACRRSAHVDRAAS